MDADVKEAFELTWARMEASATELRELIVESTRETREVIAETTRETRAMLAEHRHETGIMFEALRHDIQLVAEGVMMVDEKLDRRTAELEQKIDALADLPARVSILEEWVRRHG